MALIKCPECGYDVSDSEKTCPNCGYPISKNDHEKDISSEQVIAETSINSKRKKQYVISGIIAVLIIGISIAIPVKEYYDKPDLYEMMKDYPAYFNVIEADKQYIKINATADENIYKEGDYYYRFYYLDGDKNKPILVKGSSEKDVIDVEEGYQIFGRVGSNIGFNGDVYPGFDIWGLC